MKEIIDYYTKWGFVKKKSLSPIDWTVVDTLEMVVQEDKMGQKDEHGNHLPRFTYDQPTHICLYMNKEKVNVWFNYFQYDIKSKMIRYGMGNQSIGFDFRYDDFEGINKCLLEHHRPLSTILRNISLSAIL